MHVYIVSNKPRGVLYTGVTNDLIRRIFEHKEKITGGFTARYNLDKLMYFEEIEDPYTAITREKSLKRWPREWKYALIEKLNPEWSDLYQSLLL